MPNDGYYETHDSALAAYLLTEGFTSIRVKFLDPSCIFIFPYSAPIDQAVGQYVTGRAIGNISTFYHNYKYILTLVRDAKAGY